MYASNQHKPSIVFLPGWGFDVHIWESIAAKIKHHTCLLYNLPQTDDYQITPFSLRQVVNHLHYYLPNDCIIIAWSFSGLIAAGLSALYSHQIKKIILVSNTANFVSSEKWLGINKNITKRFYNNALHDWPQLSKRFVQLISSSNKDRNSSHQLLNHLLDGSHHSTLLFYLNILLHTNALSLYHHLSIPCLQIFGDHDLVLPFECAQQMIVEYPQFLTHIIHGAGHAPFLTHEEIFLEHISSFIESS